MKHQEHMPVPENGREARDLQQAFIKGVKLGLEYGGHQWRVDQLARAAESAFPFPTHEVHNTEEDPENRGWWWRVRAGQLEVNFIVPNERDSGWELYDSGLTPGLQPTAARCEVWAKLFKDPTYTEIIP